jgi:hypothetical protein
MDNQNQFIPPQMTPSQPVTIPPQTIIPQKPKMKLWKKILLSVIVSIVVLAALLYVAFINLPRILTMLYPNDAVLIDNSNLLLQKVNVPDADNGFFDLDKITKEMVKIPTPEENPVFDSIYMEKTKLKDWDIKTVDKVLKDNEQALSLFDSASKKNYIQIPQFSDPAKVTMDTLLPSLNTWRTVARLQAIKAKSLLLKGKPDEVLIEASKLNKVGHDIISGQGPFIGMLVGLAIDNSGSKTIIEILSNGILNKKTLENTISLIRNSSDHLEGYRNAYRYEYTNIIKAIDTINSGLDLEIQKQLENMGFGSKEARYVKYGYYYKPNQTKNFFTNVAKLQVSTIGSACEVKDDYSQLESIKKEISDGGLYFYSKMLFTENAIGKLLYMVNSATLSSAITRQCQSNFLLGVAQIQLAMKQYKLEHKTLPATLNDLVPKYLSSIPLDPFDHKPIRYSAEKKILYSVGLKQKDLGGSVGDDFTKMDNPTIKIEF